MYTIISQIANNVKILNKTFSSVTIMMQYESDAVVVGINTDDVAEYAGDYALLPYDEALSILEKDCGVKSQEVLGYEIEITRRLSEDYFVPYYKFYFISPEKEEIGKSMELTSEMGVFTEYYIRAVSDVNSPEDTSS